MAAISGRQSRATGKQDGTLVARSIIACPAGVALVVDGVDDVLDGIDDLSMQDVRGRPTFASPLGTALTRAAELGSSALLTLESGLGRPGSAPRRAVLTMAGRLVSQGVQTCGCCDDARMVIALEVTYATISGLTTTQDGEPLPSGQVRVDIAELLSPALELNPGLCQRAAEHATSCHQQELRSAVATLTHQPIGAVVGVSLGGLDPHGFDLSWVTVHGSTRQRLGFTRSATTSSDLGDLMRERLHPGLC